MTPPAPARTQEYKKNKNKAFACAKQDTEQLFEDTHLKDDIRIDV
jgi:hypothetical protein